MSWIVVATITGSVTLYQCLKCNRKKDITNLSLKIVEGKIVCPETKCKCGGVMSNMEDDGGMPGLIRTEPTLRKK